MSRFWQVCGWLAAAGAAGQLAGFPLRAGSVTNAPARPILLSVPQSALLPPAPPPPKSPVGLFRELLALNPAERENFLTNRPPANRDRILAKVREYEALDANERELRLRATELRWYLLPLLHTSPTNRAPRLAAVPDELRPLVKVRLQHWDILPPPLQQEFFGSERALRYFSHVDPTNRPFQSLMPPDRGPRPGSTNPALARGMVLSEEQRQKMAAQFNQFFELTPAEKKKTLNTLSDFERQQMEKTLATFGQLSLPQRQKCLRGFSEFAGMSAAEKQEFLNNARRWSQMSPKERQAWRDLVTHVPDWPPLPARLMPPLPPKSPHLTQRQLPLVATNPN
jgi:hypothetical protein